MDTVDAAVQRARREAARLPATDPRAIHLHAAVLKSLRAERVRSDLKANSSGSTVWGFANGANCSPSWSGNTYSYLGFCNGPLQGGYGQYFQDLIDNVNVFGGGTPIGQHVTTIRIPMAWDAAGTNSWSGTVSEGCVRPGHTTMYPEPQSISTVINAANRAEQTDGARVLIVLGPDNQDIKSNDDGLNADSYNPSIDGSSYYGYNGQTPFASHGLGNLHGVGSGWNEFCGVVELLADLQAYHIDTSKITIEPFNEPENSGENYGNAVWDWAYADLGASYYSVPVLAGVFASGGADQGNDYDYIVQYLGDMSSDGYTGASQPIGWSFHDYGDIASHNTAFPQVATFDALLSAFQFATSNVWITESGLNNYPLGVPISALLPNSRRKPALG